MPTSQPPRKPPVRATLGVARRKRALRAAFAAMAATGGAAKPKGPAKAVDRAHRTPLASRDATKRNAAPPIKGSGVSDDTSGGGSPMEKTNHATLRASTSRVNPQSTDGTAGVSVDPDGTFRPDRPRLGPFPTAEERAKLAHWLYTSPLRRGDHVELAERLHKAMEVETGGALFHDEGSFFQYHATDGVYRPIRPHEIDIRLMRFSGVPVLGGRDNKQLLLSGGDARGVLRYLQSLVANGSAQSKRPLRFADAPFGLNCTNGFLRVENGSVDLYERSPVHLARHSVPFAYRPDAPHPKLDEFFRDVFEDAVADGDIVNRIAMLQEFLGACFFGIAFSYQRMLALYGTSGGNGKSQFLQICRSIFPPDSVSSVPMTSWASRFTPIAMLGKMANFVDEIPVGVRIADTSFLKGIIDGAPVMVEEKGKQGFNAVIRCGHIVNVNRMPASDDVTPSFFRRFIVCPFECDLRNSPKKRENIGREIGESEAAGILAWAIEGARRLQARGRFTESNRGSYIMRSWRTQLDPLMRYLKEHTTVGTSYQAKKLLDDMKKDTSTSMGLGALGRWVSAELSREDDPTRMFDKGRDRDGVTYTRRIDPYLDEEAKEAIPTSGTLADLGPGVNLGTTVSDTKH